MKAESQNLDKFKILHLVLSKMRRVQKIPEDISYFWKLTQHEHSPIIWSNTPYLYAVF